MNVNALIENITSQPVALGDVVIEAGSQREFLSPEFYALRNDIAEYEKLKFLRILAFPSGQPPKTVTPRINQLDLDVSGGLMLTGIASLTILFEKRPENTFVWFDGEGDIPDPCTPTCTPSTCTPSNGDYIGSVVRKQDTGWALVINWHVVGSPRQAYWSAFLPGTRKPSSPVTKRKRQADGSSTLI